MTFYIKNATASGSSHGSLQNGGSAPATATTGTGWTVGKTAATVYSLLLYGTKRAANTFGSTALPSGAPTTTDCFRSENTLNGTFSAGSWTIAVSVISVTAAASGAGTLRARVWKSVNADGSGATEITSATAETGSWSNLLTSAAQNLTMSFNPGAVTLASQYLFLQLACKIGTASGNNSADVVLRTDGTNSKITTPLFTVKLDGPIAAVSVASATSLARARPVAGTVAAASTVSATRVDRARPLAGPIAAASSLSGSSFARAAAELGSVGASSLASASRLVRAIGELGTVGAVAAVTGSPLARAIAEAGAIGAASADTGAAAAARAIAGASDASSTASGAAAADRAVEASAAGSSSVSGEGVVDRGLEGASAGGADVSGDLDVDGGYTPGPVDLEGSLGAAASLSAPLTRARRIAGAAPGASLLEADGIARSVGAAGSVDACASLQGSMRRAVSLAGTIAVRVRVYARSETRAQTRRLRSGLGL